MFLVRIATSSFADRTGLPVTWANNHPYPRLPCLRTRLTFLYFPCSMNHRFMLNIQAWYLVLILFISYLVGYLLGRRAPLIPRKKPITRRKSYYKFQVYNPHDPWADEFGYVHLRTLPAFNYYTRRLKLARESIRTHFERVSTTNDHKLITARYKSAENLLATIPHSYGRKEYKGTRKP